MQRFTITTGAGFDANGVPLDAGKLAQALATVRADLAATFGGYTEAETSGGWVNDRGELVTEPGRRFVILSNADNPSPGAHAHPIETAERVRAAFAQQSVVLEVDAPSVVFVTHPAPEPTTLKLSA